MPISLAELATRFGCDLVGDPDAIVDHVAPLAGAAPRSLGFFTNARLRPELEATRATAVVLRADDAAAAPCAVLLSDDPYATYARMAALLHPAPAAVPGVHALAVVDPGATVAATAEIGPHVVVGARAVIGERAILGPGSIVGHDCTIGADTRLVARVTLVRNVRVGERCVLHPGAVVGADGFGNAMTPEGWVKVPQVGGVSIGNDVEIGANSTIDCGSLEDTVIADGVRIDNLCMVAHNVRIGPHTALAAMTGIAGSTEIGARCMFGGQAGAVGHVHVTDDVVVSGRGMVTKDIREPGVYASSFPLEPVRDWNRRVARVRRLDELADRVRELEKKS
ncbi:MAG TPA: UDP-3-O-(3-hydroxymyristoyl)glucosamine N-acyltransferase [Woeseiaceae bacterium]|nr:UDP-3-O-(3-hydroxymyristoyl)glucosamine N-acyltransferase [Woeseiaceae bacterium]